MIRLNHQLPIPEFVRRFLALESAGGIVMLITALVAMVMANSIGHESYETIINYPITISYRHMQAVEPFKHWVKDVLMVFFFLLVGLELKREMAEGFLSQREQILLPLLAALGGMTVPALIYLGINFYTPENFAGWAIPSATDIAFALCILTLVSRTIPPAVKIFLLAIAIFDDLGAILIIAFFYSTSLNLWALACAAVGIIVLSILNRSRVSYIAVYLLVGVYLWFCLHFAGIHTTIAGVVVGLMMPMRCPGKHEYSPVNRAIHYLHPYVAFVILPIFAFTSAGIDLGDLSFADVLKPLPIGIALALFIGKQIGIFGTTWLTIKSGIATLPDGASWRHIYGISLLAGIGFTMSLFIGILAFPEALQNEVKLGVIGGSLLSIIAGAWVLSTPRNKAAG